MKENEEKQLDQVVSKAIKKVAIKSPSVDFTETLMHKIQATHNTSTTIVYQPLISKRTWIAISALVIALIVYVLFQNIEFTTITHLVDKTTSTLPSYDLPSWELPSFTYSIEATNPFVYGAIIVAGFLFVEIAILKQKYKW